MKADTRKDLYLFPKINIKKYKSTTAWKIPSAQIIPRIYKTSLMEFTLIL
ncbi:hypothetical protein CBFG_02045 [Clostridiales bacterium 1_7_47FAA]|nr:hypothetical protein CBFG_02045 [Clostridiales bacterium 1_7_47FAA]